VTHIARIRQQEDLMTQLAPDIGRIVAIGIGATVVMDAWLLLLRRMGVPTLDFAFIGRWAAHLARGRFAHDAIAKAAPVKGELALGWLTHYAAGIVFAGAMVGVGGAGWLRTPTVLPALVVGMATVVVPLFVMQPAMGAGIASSRTPTPARNCARSLANHTVFGLGLYLAAALVESIAR
jgi:hypothetical protein